MNPSPQPVTTVLSSAIQTQVPLMFLPTPGVPLVTMVRSSVSQTLIMPFWVMVANISLLSFWKEMPLMALTWPSVWSVAERSSGKIRYKFPILVPAKISLFALSTDNELIDPFNKISASRIHFVSFPFSFLTFPSPDPTNKALLWITIDHIPLFDIY